MSQQVFPHVHLSHAQWIYPKYLSTLLRCCATFILLAISSSITHAETDADVTTKLDKLGYAQGEPVERIEHYRVDGWNYIDDKHIVIYAGPSQRFLITTMIDCSNLSWAERIGFTSTASYLTKFDKLVVRGSSNIVQHCPIGKITTLSKINAR